MAQAVEQVNTKKASGREANYENAFRLAEAGIWIFVSSGKNPLTPAWPQRDVDISEEEKAVAVEKFRNKAEARNAARMARGESTFPIRNPAHVGATRDPETIEKLRSMFPDSVVSISCGASGLYALDADSPEGVAQLEKFFEEHAIDVSACPQTRTRSGGWHVYFKNLEGDPLRNRAKIWGVTSDGGGVDARGVGGQVVSPGSIRVDGARYIAVDGTPELATAFAAGTIPTIPEHIAPLLRKLGEAAGSAERSSTAESSESDFEEQESILKNTTRWPTFSDVTDKVFGQVDLEKLKADDPNFDALWNTGADEAVDHSAVRFQLARTLHHHLGESFDVLIYAAVLGAGDTHNDSNAPRVGFATAGRYSATTRGKGVFSNYEIAREFVRTRDGDYGVATNGEGFGAVEDEEAANDNDEPDALRLEIAYRTLSADSSFKDAQQAYVEAVSRRDFSTATALAIWALRVTAMRAGTAKATDTMLRLAEMERVASNLALDEATPDDAKAIARAWKFAENAKPAKNAKATPEGDAGEAEGLSQIGVTNMLVDQNRDKFRYNKDAGDWAQWDGSRWRPDAKHDVLRELKNIIVATRQDEKAHQASFINGCEQIARSDINFIRGAADFDADPWLLGTPGGTVDLKTGKLLAARPDDLITQQSSVAPSDAIACDAWLTFLHEAVGGDADVVRYLKHWFGYCLTGVTVEEQLLYVHGQGGNGKGTMLNTLFRVFGTYARNAPPELLVSTKQTAHPTDLAFIAGARLVLAQETEKNRSWAEVRLKALTGGDPITARYMHQNNFTFAPTFKLNLSSNGLLKIRSVDDAVRRRIRILGFNRKPATPDLKLKGKLAAEAPGILRWAIEGCLEWQRAGGLIIPAAVAAQTAAYFEDQDTLGAWLSECCDLGDDFEASSGELFASWCNFTAAAKAPPGSLTSFGEDLGARGFAPLKKVRDADGRNVRGRGGLRLRGQDDGCCVAEEDV